MEPSPLRILVVADSKIPIPPKGYGGAERILALLCSGLAEQGHRVTLMASKGSENYGRLIVYPWAGRHSLFWRAYCKANFSARSFYALTLDHDLIVAACRIDYLSALLSSSLPMIYVFHNPIVLEQVRQLEAMAKGSLRLVSVSDSQRRALPGPNWTTIYNAVNTERLVFSERPSGSYLAFLGRLAPSKGVDTAIRVARRLGVPLKIAGNIPDEEGARDYFEREVRAHLGEMIHWVGEIDDNQKVPFLGQARGLLMPIQWDEPFGIVVAEALACGTPVIANNRGAMQELIRHGQTGYLAETEDAMVEFVRRVHLIDRRTCRADAESRFSKERLVSDYLKEIRSAIADRSIGGGRLERHDNEPIT